MAECLEKPFSLAEIECAVEGRSGDRAPEPDGFPISFFQYFWNDIKKDDLYIFFQDFFSSGKFLKALGASFVTLIPKKAGVISIRDFRPISLIGSIELSAQDCHAS